MSGCAGINRRGVVDARATQERSSEPSCPRVMRSQSRGWVRSVDRGTCRRDIELRNNRPQSADAVQTGGRQHLADAKTRAFTGFCAVREPRHAWKLHAREPGGPVIARKVEVSGPAGEGHEPEVQHERCRGVGRSYSTNEVPEQRREIAGGGRGGKATDQGEHRADDRVTDPELHQRVERLARCAGSSTKGEAVTFYRATPPRLCFSTTGQLLLSEARSCTRDRWNDLEGVRDGPGQAAGGFTRPGAPGNVSSATFQESLHPQSRWTTATLGHCSPGGQNRSVRRGDGPQSNL